MQTCHEGRNELLEGLTLNREVVGEILVGFDGQKWYGLDLCPGISNLWLARVDIY